MSILILKRERWTLVGKSGCGKSTLADLLSRFYDVNEGGIFIDNTNIKDIAMADLKSLMGIVSQESILFNDTIYNNIRLGKIDATKDEIIAAAKVANAHKFILETENGYNTNIGDETKLSEWSKTKTKHCSSNA